MKSREIFFEKIPSTLLVLLPFSLITGPFISDLSISIIALIFIARCVVYKDFSYFNNKYFKYFITFYFVCLLSSIKYDQKVFHNLNY